MCLHTYIQMVHATRFTFVKLLRSIFIRRKFLTQNVCSEIFKWVEIDGNGSVAFFACHLLLIFVLLHNFWHGSAFYTYVKHAAQCMCMKWCNFNVYLLQKLSINKKKLKKFLFDICLFFFLFSLFHSDVSFHCALYNSLQMCLIIAS